MCFFRRISRLESVVQPQTELIAVVVGTVNELAEAGIGVEVLVEPVAALGIGGAGIDRRALAQLLGVGKTNDPGIGFVVAARG